MSFAGKNCFIITPIGGDNTDIRRAAEGVIDAAIIPVLKELGFDQDNILVPHRMQNPGSITGQIIFAILNVDLVIVNLTGLNPNVMYEVAIRHAVRKPMVPICEVGTNLPFDIIDQRTIFYANDIQGCKELQARLRENIPAALAESSPDNPIYRVISDAVIKQNKEATVPATILLERLEVLEKNIANLVNDTNKFRISPTESYYKTLASTVPPRSTVDLVKDYASESPVDALLRGLAPNSMASKMLEDISKQQKK